MHILIIPSWYPNSYNKLSGIFFKEQAEAIFDTCNKCKVGVIAPVKIGKKEFLKKKSINFGKKYNTVNGIPTYIFEYPPIINQENKLVKKIDLFFFIKMFKDYIKKYGKPDIVHLHSFYSGNLAIYLKENHNIPYILTEHSSAFARKILKHSEIEYAKDVFRQSSYNIAVSFEFKKLLNNNFSTNFDYIPNMIDSDFFDVFSKNKKKDFIFINVAFLNPNKKQPMLIKAFYQAFQKKNDVKLIIVGNGPEFDNLKKLIEELHMEKQIILYGRANREEIKKLYQQSNAFVLSSQYETFGVVVIEAMACGLPAISTKCGGPESIIVSDKLGLLTEINKKDLKDKMLFMYENYVNYDSSFIQNYVESNFSKKTITRKIINIYKKVIEND